VRILEKNQAVGGKMAEIRDGPYRWDTGPSVITMRHVFENLFAAADRHLSDYVQLLPVDPLTRYFFADGTRLDVSRDWPEMALQISQFEERDVEGYLRFLSYAARLHRITGPVFIYGRPPTLRSLLSVPPKDMLAVEPWRTMNSAISRYVRSDHLRQLLGRFATYVGASPFLAPATLNVVAHVELSGGVWYPVGGVHALARALQKLATELGIEICTGSEVTEIMLDGDSVSGLALADGTRVRASRVIANVDVATVYSRLLPQTNRFAVARARVLNSKTSCSGFAMLLGVNKSHRDLAHHNIFFSSNYRREFEEIFGRGRPPSEPTVYVAITSRTDPDHAPPGAENWFVLVNAPGLGGAYNWEDGVDEYRGVVLERLALFGFDLRDFIEVEHIITPVTIEQHSGARLGALYGISSNEPLNAFRRPHNRAPDVHGLYFAGGTTHPGGGVPMVILSGKVAADMVLSSL